jgi:hypothetical protein
MTDEERKASNARFQKYVEFLKIEWDDATLQECARVRARDVQSDFEIQVKQEINAWVKKQPPHKSWSTPAHSAQEFWNERLN